MRKDDIKASNAQEIQEAADPKPDPAKEKRRAEFLRRAEAHYNDGDFEKAVYWQRRANKV